MSIELNARTEIIIKQTLNKLNANEELDHWQHPAVIRSICGI